MFVARSLALVCELTCVASWKQVLSEQNSADLISRVPQRTFSWPLITRSGRQLLGEAHSTSNIAQWMLGLSSDKQKIVVAQWNSSTQTTVTNWSALKECFAQRQIPGISTRFTIICGSATSSGTAITRSQAIWWSMGANDSKSLTCPVIPHQ